MLKQNLKRFIIVAWIAGFSAFMMAGVFGRGFFLVGMCIGLLNAVTAPAPELFGTSATKINQVVGFFLNLMLAVILTYLIALVWQHVYENIFALEMEPILFGVIYSVLHMVVVIPLSMSFFAVKKRML